MFNLTKEEHAKIVEAISAILACGNETTDKVFVSYLDLCEHLDVTGPRRRQLLKEEISDILNGRDIVRKFGSWIMHEFNDDEYLFVRLFAVAKEAVMKDHILYGGCAALSFQKGWPDLGRKAKTKTSTNVQYFPTLLDSEEA